MFLKIQEILKCKLKNFYRCIEINFKLNPFIFLDLYFRTSKQLLSYATDVIVGWINLCWLLVKNLNYF